LNCNDLGDTKKFKFLSHLTIEKSLDFIALLETSKRECSETFLKNLCAGTKFLWHYIQTVDISEIEEGKSFIKFKIHSRETDYKCLIVSVYGAAQQELTYWSCLTYVR
jgi:hypothetical protein